ncbi:MAG: TIGR03086 family metal-binding protein [Pseudonocardiaceae bacterium]
MGIERAMAPLIGGVGLLERAITYTLGSLHIVTPEGLSNPTPCRDWDLRALLRHMNDSLLALQEAIDIGRVDLDCACGDGGPDADPVAVVRDRACLLLGAWTNASDPQVVSIAGVSVATGIVTGAGALEVAVHGWDVAQACGRPRPMPPPLAEELLPMAALVVTDADRPARFAAPRDLPPAAGPAGLLLAFLGRRPD